MPVLLVSVLTSRQVHVDRQALRRQVHAPVVLGVAQTLDVEQPHLGRLDRKRAPVPGPAMQHERLQRLDPEHPDGPTSAGVDELQSDGATAITAGTSSGMRACVCVSWRKSISQRSPRSSAAPRSGHDR